MWLLTIFGHSHGKALLEATVLAAVPIYSHDETLVSLATHPVLHVVLDTPSKETLEIEEKSVMLNVRFNTRLKVRLKVR